MYRVFTPAEAESILRASEGRATSHRRADKDRDSAAGHAGAQHFLLSNNELRARYWEARHRANSKDYLVITAFVGGQKGEIGEAAASVLNATQTQATLGTFFSRNGEEGMRAEIHFTGSETYKMRCVTNSGHGVQTIPTSSLVMVLDKHRSALSDCTYRPSSEPSPSCNATGPPSRPARERPGSRTSVEKRRKLVRNTPGGAHGASSTLPSILFGGESRSGLPR